MVIHHQFEKGQLMPEALAFKKSAMSLIFECLEKERGRGWWGSEEMADYYINSKPRKTPLAGCKVVPL